MNTSTEEIFNSLKKTLDSYYPLSEKTWKDFRNICTIKEIKKNAYAFELYDNVDAFSYVYEGLFRTFSFNEKAEEYTKKFFWETKFYGPMVALLYKKPINAVVQAIEDSIVIDIKHDKYRKLLETYDDLKFFHIFYLEKHWVLERDDIGSSLVLDNAKKRYEKFNEEFKNIIKRIPKHYIASYLGISPTHLSRIRRELKKKGNIE
ncbi:Crp/Fnr family transcriptional regulator [Arcobacter sp. F2176]|uniref:Crp/Fnr family transcriptional regulator n=1 Tax=Arcobacter sp. F2176 TaxID=2044511 RepID=UPI00100AF168|nr:Crp/Fnr family transcriptional regulator [Arcobacter sp. F2176]RXJ79399.1 cyclic nucleotide-binding protein [Arcobacter sp. F2176]